jgi:hypothetical protein
LRIAGESRGDFVLPVLAMELSGAVARMCDLRVPWLREAWGVLARGRQQFTEQLKLLRSAVAALQLRGREKREQEALFGELAPRFFSTYSRLAEFDAVPFMTDRWRECERELEESFRPVPSFAFLRNRAIRDMMFVSAGGEWLLQEIASLEAQFQRKELLRLLREDPVGSPLLASMRYATSHNAVHHLYHLARYQSQTAASAVDARTVIEWGGGYGSQARMFLRLAPAEVTYVIVDLAFLTSLQSLYLSVVVGPERVHLIDSPSASVQNGKINLLPVPLVDSQELSGDLFISTWALSESSDFAQDYVAENGWFGCQQLLLAYQDAVPDYPFADRLGRIAQADGAVVDPISFLPGNYYAFR